MENIISEKHKAGFVNIIGNPNVGKSTLMNLLVGERISAITNKAQTTRHRILGIVNTDDYQIVFSDTPGVLKPLYELQEKMMDSVKSAFKDADILIYMVEMGEGILKDPTFFTKIINIDVPVILLLNKIDLTDQVSLEETVAYWHKKVPNATILPISAKEKFNTDLLLQKIIEYLPEAPPYYPKDQLTDRPERFFVNETIREKVLLNYKKEVPYSVEIVTEAFTEDPYKVVISSVIYVERDSQKGIIIGHQGKSLTKVGTEARLDLEQFFQKKVHLSLFVKVKKEWRKNMKDLDGFGY